MLKKDFKHTLFITLSLQSIFYCSIRLSDQGPGPRKISLQTEHVWMAIGSVTLRHLQSNAFMEQVQNTVHDQHQHRAEDSSDKK